MMASFGTARRSTPPHSITPEPTPPMASRRTRSSVLVRISDTIAPIEKANEIDLRLTGHIEQNREVACHAVLPIPRGVVRLLR